MELLKKYLRKFLMKHASLRVFVRKIHVALKKKKFEMAASGAEIDKKLVIFETFMGRQYGCNPRAIYEYMLSDERFDDFTFVWVLNDEGKVKEFPQLERAKIVKLRSDEYYKYYATAGYVITNSNLDYGIAKRDGQKFLQTWHGTPLKRLRCDIEAEEGNALNSLEEINQKNDLDVKRYDYFISPSAFSTEKFRSAFNLTNLGLEDIIIETGYPRNDLLFKFDEEYAAKIKSDLGIPDDKKVILYAPTFRDNQHDGSGYTYKTEVDFDKLRRELSDEYVILFRAHYFVASQFDFASYKGFVIDASGLDDITPLYTVADLLITDYSSVFFDYANLKRPMYFYMYDLEDYADNIRGFYIDINELPGPIIQEEDELIKAIKAGDWSYDDKYKAFNEKYNYLDDAFASKRVVDILIGEE